jgi:hypothetical protein
MISQPAVIIFFISLEKLIFFPGSMASAGNAMQGVFFEGHIEDHRQLL